MGNAELTLRSCFEPERMSVSSRLVDLESNADDASVWAETDIQLQILETHLKAAVCRFRMLKYSQINMQTM